MQNVFKRYEKKYMLSESQYQGLRAALDNKMKQDEYGRHTICNLYFDTPDFHLIRQSIQKPVYKEKLRLRSYGAPGPLDSVFVELKKKYDKVVYKRRIEMAFCHAEDYLIRGKAAPSPNQISKEIDWFMDFYRPIPRMYISYDRIALYGKEDEELRITFDTNIRWRTTFLSLSAGVWGDRQLEKGQRLMEIKIAGAIPYWLSDILTGLGIFPVSYSKYGVAYLEMLKKNDGRAYLERRELCA